MKIDPHQHERYPGQKARYLSSAASPREQGAQRLESMLQRKTEEIKKLLAEANRLGLKVHNAPKVSSHEVHVTVPPCTPT